MYQQYWGLNEAPFDNVPDPGMYFRMHASFENAIAELLFAIEEGNECLALLIGDVGLGKTMALRVVLDKLEHDNYRIAFVTNPDLTFPQLMREIIGQLQGEECKHRSREALLDHFNRFLLEVADSGQKVLLFIDEGQALRGPVLESMRLLTSIQENKRNLLTIILAGQPELGTMLTVPRRANLLQRVGVCPILEPLGSEDLVGDYIDHRMERAGSTRSVFTNSGIASVYEFSEGVPRLINRFCKLCLKAGETNRLNEIGAEVVSAVGNQFQPSRLLQGLANTRAKKVRIQENPDEEPADENAEEASPSPESIPASETHRTNGMHEGGAHTVEPGRGVPAGAQPDNKAPYQEQGLEPDVDSSHESIPGPESHPIEETHAIKSGCRVSVEAQQDGKPTDAEPGLDPDVDFSDRLPSEQHPADHHVEGASSSHESIPGSESHPIEETHAIKSGCRVSVEAQPNGKPTYQEPVSDSDSDPDMEFFDPLPSELQGSLPPDELPVDQNSNGVSATQEPLSETAGEPVEGAQAINSDCRVSADARLDEDLPDEIPGFNQDMDFFDRLRSELQTSQSVERSLSQNDETESLKHLDPKEVDESGLNHV